MKDIPIWLIWEQPSNGVISLRAVATSQKNANMYRAMIKEEGRELIKVWAEQRIADHLYAHTLHIVTALYADHK